MNEPNYYAIIPANVRYDNCLTDKAKLLYGEITALSDKNGYCFASNAYFARLYSCNDKTISRTISQLLDGGYIKVVLLRDENTQQIKQRKISLKATRQKTHYPSDEKRTDIITSNNINGKRKKRNQQVVILPDVPDGKRAIVVLVDSGVIGNA